MPEPVESQAASTPAKESETPDASERLAALSPDQYQNWRRTGELPAPPKSEGSAPASGAAAPPANGEVADEAAPASEPAKVQEPEGEKKHRGTPAAERKAQLAAEIDELLTKRRTLFREVEELERKLATGQRQDATPADSWPAKPALTRPEPTPDDVDGNGQPKYATYEDYLRDLRAWDREQFKAELKAEKERERAEAAATKVREKQETALRQAHAEGEKRQKDYASKVYAADSPLALIPENSPMDAYLMEAIEADPAKGSELLYHLATHVEEVERIRALTGKAQDRAMHDLARSLSEKAPNRTISAASPPPSEVGGTAITPKDPIAAAAKAGDFAAYKKAADAEDQKRFALGRKG